MRALKLAKKFNVARIRRELKSVEGGFANFYSSDPEHAGRIHGEIGILPILSRGERPTLMPDGDILARRLPYLKTILSSLDAPIYSARFIRAMPKSSILAHRDSDRSFQYGVLRLHIPISDVKKSGIYIRGKKISMRPGELFWVDVCEPHAMSCDAAEPYVALVLDVGLTEELTTLFPRGVRKKVAKLATFDERTEKFFDPRCRGIYKIPRGFVAPVFRARDRRASFIQISSSKKKKTNLCVGGRKIPLVRDSNQRIRLDGYGPGIFFQMVGHDLRLERRGVIRSTTGQTSLFSVSVRLKRTARG